MKKLILFLFCFYTAISAQNTTKFITVIGTAETFVPADEIFYNLYINTICNTMSECKTANDQVLNQTLKILNECAILKDEINISPISLNRNYDYTTDFSTSKRQQNGFIGSVDISFKLTDFSKYLELTEKIANLPSLALNLHYSLSREKYDAVKLSLQSKALLSAKNKAAEMADVLNMKLGVPLEIEEISINDQVISPSSNSIVEFDRVNEISFSASKLAGKINIKKSVRVKFELLQK